LLWFFSSFSLQIEIALLSSQCVRQVLDHDAVCDKLKLQRARVFLVLIEFATHRELNVDLTTAGQLHCACRTMSDSKLSASFMNQRPTWKDDASSSTCIRCKKDFTLLRRKHHCRMCGELVCGACSNNFIPIPKLSYRYEVRVCSECFTLISRPI
jgi:hypothetical protein